MTTGQQELLSEIEYYSQVYKAQRLRDLKRNEQDKLLSELVVEIQAGFKPYTTARRVEQKRIMKELNKVYTGGSVEDAQYLPPESFRPSGWLPLQEYAYQKSKFMRDAFNNANKVFTGTNKTLSTIESIIVLEQAKKEFFSQYGTGAE